MKTCNPLTFKELYEKDYVRRPEGGDITLWHYTNAEGLMGVVRNDKAERGKLHFWFTRSDCLNDPSEGTHIMELYYSVCDEMLESGEISKEFYEAIKGAKIEADQFIEFPASASEDGEVAGGMAYVPCHAYICSFSFKEDSLDMWRYYSKGKSGYGLKCDSKLFSGLSAVHAYPVIYDDGEKRKILKELISDVFCAQHGLDFNESDKLKAALGLIQTVLKRFQFEFKHDCYASEQEYRFVIYRPIGEAKAEMSQNGVPELRFRAQGGILVPYVDMTIENGDAFLQEVLISPFIENAFVMDTTREYLAQCGYDCPVRESQLPVR